MRCAIAILLIPGLAHADARYTMVSHAASGSGAPTVVDYLVGKDTVRVGAADAQRYQLFKDGTIYFVDTASRSVQTISDATVSGIKQQMADKVKKMEEMACQAPPDRREMAERTVAMMKEVNERRWQEPPREFRITPRFETAPVGTCRIWEEVEQGVKRLELCVAPTATIPGGEEVLHGMRILSSYLNGSLISLGVYLGSTDVWPRIEGLGGLPVMVREFKDGALLSETTMTAAGKVPDSDGLLEVPPDYQRKEGPKPAPR